MADLITVNEALDRVRACAKGPEQTETVPLDAARGRRIAEDVVADGPWPVTDRSAMDGFAMATGGSGIVAGTSFPIVGQALAGHPFDTALTAGQAVRIMTGGVVPEGADTVVKVEDTSGFESAENVEVRADVPSGANIRLQGSEIAPGTTLMTRGTRLGAAQIGALAVLGHANVAVFRRPRVAILSTGDEVVPIDQKPLPHQVRDSNAWALAAQIEECGGEPIRLGIASDEASDLRSRLDDGLARADVVLTIGGVSKGTHDLVHGTLRDLGVESVFHGVIVKPGKPLYFGRRGDGPPFVFGLPGNPASAFTTFHVFVRPLIRALGGADSESDGASSVRVAGAPFRKNWRAQAIPAVVGEASDAVAELQTVRPSGDPFGLAVADGFAIIPADTAPEDVDRVEFLPFRDRS